VLSAALVALAALAGCDPSGTVPLPSPSVPGTSPAATAGPTTARASGDLVIVGRILTMDAVLAAAPDEIRAMTTVATIVGGVVVYCGDPATCEDSTP
jgi:hypothetical protein